MGFLGDDSNWFGHHLAGTNLYGYGRLCWDPDLESGTITDEWVRRTFGHDSAVVETVSEVLLDSWEA